MKIERIEKERKKERSYKEWGNMKIERMGKERKKLQRMGKYED